MLSLDFNNEVIKAAPIAGVAGADGSTLQLSPTQWFKLVPR